MKNYLTITIETMESPVNLARKSVAEREVFSIGGMKFLAFGMNSNRESVASMDAIQIYLDPIPEWNGYGLPPVGTVCDLRNVAAGTDWGEATIVFASRNVVVWDWVGEPSINGLCTAYAHAVEMRPILTPEQIAAEERKRITDDIQRVCVDGENNGVPFHEALYEAGYRKQACE